MGITEAHPGNSDNDWAIAEGHPTGRCREIPLIKTALNLELLHVAGPMKTLHMKFHEYLQRKCRGNVHAFEGHYCGSFTAWKRSSEVDELYELEKKRARVERQLAENRNMLKELKLLEMKDVRWMWQEKATTTLMKFLSSVFTSLEREAGKQNDVRAVSFFFWRQKNEQRQAMEMEELADTGHKDGHTETGCGEGRKNRDWTWRRKDNQRLTLETEKLAETVNGNGHTETGCGEGRKNSDWTWRWKDNQRLNMKTSGQVETAHGHRWSSKGLLLRQKDYQRLTLDTE
ncbi:hypothetical protein MAR_005786 [Mya arenaria]|uniref:Uncharacterized protein n=1 Tax=Mya arenaria TaxID=6604 RepID=A0ABY7F4F2_MYAAR|nr:hypothetical protein MAR_005786 [Mya arenaria]